MAVSALWDVTFRVVNINPSGGIRILGDHGVRKAIVIAATQSAAVTRLNANVSGQGAETVEIIDIHQHTIGEAVYT